MLIKKDEKYGNTTRNIFDQCKCYMCMSKATSCRINVEYLPKNIDLWCTTLFNGVKLHQNQNGVFGKGGT